MGDSYHWSGYCWAGRDHCAFSLENDASDPREYLTVERLSFRPITPASTTGGSPSPTLGVAALKLTSAQSGGVAVPCAPLDTTSTALPSQVAVAVFPQVTESSQVRGHAMCPTGITNLVLPALGRAQCGAAEARTDTASLWESGYGSSDCQKLHLAEGQGVALVPAAPTLLPPAHAWNCTIVFNVGSATWVATCTILPTWGGFASFGIFNGSGSGVTIDIVSIDITYTGVPLVGQELTGAPYVRVARLAGAEGGVAETPIPFDSYSPVPASMVLSRGMSWAPIDANSSLATDRLGLSAGDLGYPGGNDALVRRIGVYHNAAVPYHPCLGPGLAAGTVASEFEACRTMHGVDYQRRQGDIGGIVLRKSQAIGLVVSNPTSFGYLWVECEWTRTPPSDNAVAAIYVS